MQYTQAQIDRANAVSLEDFLRTQGETLIKSGREYRWKEHDSLTVRGNKWFRHSQSKGGYPIDFVMEFYGKSFPEAVQLLTGESGEGQSEASTAPPTAFHLPLHNRTADRAIQYLTESRGLNKTLVEAFLLSGDIYEDAKRHNVVFVGRDRNGTPRYAHVRGTADPFRQDITGSDKSYPFRYEGNGNQLFVFEAPIDLLSFICLYPQDWQTRSYLALGGVSGKALDRFLSERKDTRKVFLCLDSDTAGSEACTRLAQSIPGEIAVIRLVPARKDWNDVLRQQGDIPSRKFIAETRLLDIRENVRGAIKTTDKNIAKTALLAKGFSEAGQTAANAFRTFADKPKVDYSQKEQKHPITKAVLAPMKAVRKLFVSMELHLDASIDKLDNLAMNVQLDKEKHMENAKAQEQTEPERAGAERVEAEIVYLPMVAEPQEYQYNADAFEARGVDEVKQEAAHKEVSKVREDKAR